MMQQAVAMLRRVGGLGSTPRLASVPALMQLQRHMSGCKLFIGGEILESERTKIYTYSRAIHIVSYIITTVVRHIFW